MQGHTIRALFVHNDWARDTLLASARELSDEQLDRPFDIGLGTLRNTLRHLYGAERIWFERWQGAEQRQFPRSREITAMSDLGRAWRDLAAERNELLDGVGEGGLQREVSYADSDGTGRQRLGDLMLHVCNHGYHHRAQALNLLRRVGVDKRPGLDYLYMKLERPAVEYAPDVRTQLAEMGIRVGDETAPPDRLDLETIRAYYRYGDWACEHVFAIAETLNDGQLDRPFEIGVGQLRKTLLHIREAEHWWCENWTAGPQSGYKEMPATTSIGQLRTLFAETAARRDAYLASLTDPDLERVVAAEARPGLTLRFGLGESMLQLCSHGTHHRAQALNMLRQLGAAIPALDYADWLHHQSRDA